MRKLWIIAVIALAVQLGAQESRLVEWPYWGGDAANTRYSTLAGHHARQRQPAGARLGLEYRGDAERRIRHAPRARSRTRRS